MNRAELAEIENFVGVGSVLAGKYRIERVLGMGGMGAVVQAQHLQLHESVAIKFLLARAGQGERLAARFLREARTASKLKSAHVARVFDVDSRPDGTPYIVMEYLHGETLAARLERDPVLSAQSIVDDVLEACVALAEAHALGIVHRDLKPANLFLASGAGGVVSVRVLDFGISKLLEPDSSGDVITQDLPIGSPPYMSPEQLTLPASVDHRTDIWSLGVVLYQAFTGDLPFSGDTFAQVCANVLQTTPPPIRQSRELGAIVQRCLSKEREGRYQSISELASALSQHATDRGQRALALVRTLAKAPAPQAVPAQARPAPSATASAPEVGTLTATANPTHAPVTLQKPKRRALLALGVLPLVAALIWARFASERSDQHDLRSDARHSAEPQLLPAAEPSHAATRLPALSATPSASPPRAVPAASASSSAPIRSRNPAASRAKPARGGGEGRGGEGHEFDPVFDERR